MAHMDCVRCSDISRDAGEPLLGTATHVDVWLLIEYRAVWKAKALDDNNLAEPVMRWIEDSVAKFQARGLKARPQFIRQPIKPDPMSERPAWDAGTVRVIVARGDGLATRMVPRYQYLADIDPTELPMQQDQAPLYFVCTNGQRDNCCALYGLPLYRRLAELVGTRAWQISHVGGHRYAPNVLVVPTPTLYGRVDAEAAEGFVEAVEGGAVPMQYLRGRTDLAPEAQVAVASVEGACSVTHKQGERITLATERGEQVVTVRRSQESYSVIPSCGVEPEEVSPLTLG